jgi:serine/threonine-protein kinase ULK/ATG1
MSKEGEERLKTIEHYSYYLSDNIGKGFSSIVYKGKNKQNGLPVAIKVIDLRKLS